MSNSSRMHACAYCGERTTNAIACSRHTDLPKLDPYYNPKLRRHEIEPDRRFSATSAPVELTNRQGV